MYLLTEQIMNGTVTLQIVSTAIDAFSFKEAVKKVKDLLDIKEAEIQEDTDRLFSYRIYGPQLSYYGRITDKELKII